MAIATDFRLPIDGELGSDFWVTQAHGELNTTVVTGQNRWHLGVDLSAAAGNGDLGEPILAAANGRVVFSQSVSGGWGNVIAIEHTLSDGSIITTMYAHLLGRSVFVGDEVSIGQQIGGMGNAGGIYLAHLHYEVREGTFSGVGSGYTSTGPDPDPTSGNVNPIYFHENLDDYVPANGPTNGPDEISGSSAGEFRRGLDGDDTIYGLDGNDELWGDADEDQVYGGGGNDTLQGGDDDDTLFGEADNDTLLGESGRDTSYGGDGADSLRGNGGDDDLRGEDGNDTVYGDEDFDALYGGLGGDQLRGGVGEDSLYGEEDGDLLDGEQGDDALFGGVGNDSLYGGDSNDTLVGGTGNDYLNGYTGIDLADYADETESIVVALADSGLGSASGSSIGNDWLESIEEVEGSSANDTLSGNASGNELDGNEGDDSIRGYNGNDYLKGNDGQDTVWGDSGSDSVYGGDDADDVRGGADNDEIFGGTGADDLRGEGGTDTLDGGLDTDSAHYSGNRADYDITSTGIDSFLIVDTRTGGSDGADTVLNVEQFYFNGQLVLASGLLNELFTEGADDIVLTDVGPHDALGGNDTVVGTSDSDTIYGGADSDSLSGERGKDVLVGKGGSDVLSGGRGNDKLTGGGGRDTFNIDRRGGDDRVKDFQDNVDTLAFDSSLWGGTSMTAEQFIADFVTDLDSDLLIEFSDGTSVLMSGIGDAGMLANDLSFTLL